MAVGGIGTGGYGAYGVAGYTSSGAGATRQTGKGASDASGSGASGSGAVPTGDDAATAFLREAHKTPAERVREQWLKSHNLSEDDLAAMSPEKRKAIEDAMAEDMRRRVTDKSAPRGSLLDLSA